MLSRKVNIKKNALTKKLKTGEPIQREPTHRMMVSPVVIQRQQQQQQQQQRVRPELQINYGLFII